MTLQRFNLKANILENIEIRPDIFLMKVSAHQISQHAIPGQFCMLRSNLIDGYDPLLRRPLSIHRACKKTGQLEFLYRVVGRGTKALAKHKPGEKVDLLGPLGSGFHVKDHEIPILVGGGLGVAPLLFLAESLPGRKGVVIIGAVTKSQLLRLEPLRETGLEILLTTEDGSFGNKGLVTEVLDRLLTNLDNDAKRDVAIFSCGPMPMLRAIYHLCQDQGVRCQVSLETVMACGSGLCLGCALPARDGYVHVCKEGPCFEADQLEWE